MNDQRTCSRCPAFLAAPDSIATGLCHGCRSPKAEQVVTETPPPIALEATSGNAGCDDFVRRHFVVVGTKVSIRQQKNCDSVGLTPEQTEFLIAHLQSLLPVARRNRARVTGGMFHEDVQPAGLHETDYCPL